MIPQFDFSTFLSQTVWLTVAFAAQYIIVAKVIVPGFKSIYSARKEYIESKLKYTDSVLVEAENLKKSYEEKVSALTLENSAAMRKAIADVKSGTDKKLQELEEVLSQDLKEYEKSLEDFKDSIAPELNAAIISVAASLINKLSNKNINPKSLNRYIN